MDWGTTWTSGVLSLPGDSPVHPELRTTVPEKAVLLKLQWVPGDLVYNADI